MIAGYGEVYRTECLVNSTSAYYVTPGARTLYRIRFWKKGFTGSFQTLNGGEEPWTAEVGEDELFGLMPTKITIGLLPNPVGLDNFFAEEEREIGVTLEQKITDTIYQRRFSGWISPHSAKQAYKQKVGPIELSAACGLGSLSDFPFYQHPTGVPYTGLNTLHDIVWTCLSWVGYDIPLHVSVHCYEESMTASMSDPFYNPLQHVKHQLTNYQKSSGEWENCKEVLEKVLQAFNATLFQEDGVWKLMRRDEATTTYDTHKWIVYGDASVNTGMASNDYALKTVAYKGDGTPLKGGKLGIETAKRYWVETYHYGEPVNLLRNGDFSTSLTGWTRNNAVSMLGGAIGDGTESSPFGLEIFGTSSGDQQLNAIGPLYQEVTIQRTSQTITANVRGQLMNRIEQPVHVIQFSGRYINQGTSGPKIRITAYVTNSGKAEAYDLAADGTWGNGSKVEHYLMYSNVLKQGSTQLARPTSGETFTVQATQDVPGQGAYTIRIQLYAGVALYGDTSPLNRIVYRGFRLGLLDGESLELVSEQLTAEPPNVDVSARKKRETLDTYLGDQTTAQGGAGVRTGALYREDGQTPTVRWVMGGVTDRLQNHSVKGRLRLLGKQNRTYEGTLKSTSIRFSDILVMTELGYRAFILRYTRRLKSATVEVSAMEVSATDVAPLTGNYLNPNGDKLPMGDASEPAPIGQPSNAVYLPRQNTATGTMGIFNRIRQGRGIVIPPGQAVSGDLGGLMKVNERIIAVMHGRI